MSVKEATLTRRSFVKAATVAGAALALSARQSGFFEDADKAWAASESERTMYYSTCHGCIQTCPCKVYVQDGVIVKIEGDKRAPTSLGSMCMKGTNQIHTLYSPRRVLYPIKRSGPRGAEAVAWERVSWDDAVEEAGTQIAEAAKKYGTYALLTSTGGGGGYSFGIANTFNMALGSPNVIEPGCAQCYLPRMAIGAYMYGGSDQSIADCAVLEPWKGINPLTAAQGVQNKMTLLVSWGAQPSVSQTAQSGRAVAEIRELGCQTIVVDPNYTPDAVKADYWLRVRPGTDTGVLLSWFREIFAQKWYNEEFVKYWTNLPFLIDTSTWLPLYAKDVWPDYVQTTPDDTPVYVCFDLRTNQLQPFPYSAPEDSPVDPEIFWDGAVPGKSGTYKSAGQIYKEEAEPWTFEHTEEICWVPAAVNSGAVNLYAHPKNGVAGIAHGVATDMEQQASQAPLGCLGLDMIMGYINKEGVSCTQNAGGWGGFYPDPSLPITRPLQSYFSDGVGWTIGLSEAANKAQVENFADKNIQYIKNTLLLDRLGTRDYKGLYHWSHSHIPTVLEAIATGIPFQPHVWFDTSGNKLAMLGNAGSWFDVFDKIDYCICQYPNLTSFQVEIGDLILPLEEWAETSLMPFMQLNWRWPELQIVHLGETVPNYVPAWLMVLNAAEKMNAAIDQIVLGAIGGVTGITSPVNVNSSNEQVIDQSKVTLKFPLGSDQPGMGGAPPSPVGWLSNDCQPDEQTFQQTIAMAYGAPDYPSLVADQDKYLNVESLQLVPNEIFWAYNQHERTAIDGLPQGFSTESRKCEVYCWTLVKMAATGFPWCYPNEHAAVDPEIGDGKWKGMYSPICQYIEPVETSLQSDANYDAQYPLTLTSGRVYYWHHGTMRGAPFARELLAVPDVRIHPDTAAKYGIEHMDFVKVTSRRSSTHGRAYLTTGQHPDVIFMERFWNPECFDSSQKVKTGGWRECNVNVLTKNSPPFNEVFGSYTNRGFTVNIEKSTKPENIWVEPKEFAPFLPTNTNQYTAGPASMYEEEHTPMPTLPHLAGGAA